MPAVPLSFLGTAAACWVWVKLAYTSQLLPLLLEDFPWFIPVIHFSSSLSRKKLSASPYFPGEILPLKSQLHPLTPNSLFQPLFVMQSCYYTQCSAWKASDTDTQIRKTIYSAPVIFSVARNSCSNLQLLYSPIKPNPCRLIALSTQFWSLKLCCVVQLQLVELRCSQALTGFS